MTPSVQNAQLVVDLLKPENDLEKKLLFLPEFQHGLFWGEPRFGHPEGKVLFHVREVLDNIDQIHALPPAERSRLRLIAFAHDTFKYKEDRSRPRQWKRHHAFLAREFMNQYSNDPILLDILETHDDAFYAWLRSRVEVGFTPTHHPSKTLDDLIERVGYCIQTYYLFFKCDTQTGDKTQAPLRWFEGTVPGIKFVPVRERAFER